MAVAVSYPGVYLQEVSSGVRTITGVATSVAAFVDFFPAGTMNKAQQIFSFADFESQFGGLNTGSEASYAIQQFFLNGGTEAYVVRVGAGATKAAVELWDQSGGAAVLVVTAKDEGAWGNNLRIDVDYGTTDPAKLFNLTVSEIATVNGGSSVVASEIFRNLVIDPAQANDAAAVVNGASQLIQMTASAGSTGKRPAQTGTSSKQLTTVAALNLAAGDKLDVSLGANKVGTIAGLAAPLPATPSDLAAALQAQLRALMSGSNKALPNATVTVVGSASSKWYLVVEPGTAAPSDFLSLTDSGGSTLAGKLGFAAAQENVQQYALGADAQAKAQGTPTKGADGSLNAAALIGDPNAKSGMYALLDVDLFNILCIPATMNLADSDAAQVAAQATALCTQRRAMYLLDVPQPANAARDTVPSITSWLDANSGLRSRNAALYFPRVDIADPLNGFRLRQVAPSGTVAGLWARTDGARGVWKAPAGTEATLAGVQKLEYKLTDPENGVLNPLAINCLRTFPIYGPVCWGARTLYGADQMADDYKYIPIRRLALFIEESLYRGTQWVVFEPNDTPLWAQIRLNVGAFMQTLFRQGAFQGSTPQDAYFVQCDDKTNPQATINLGIVNIVVGFAPLKPAEFVVIQIQQMAGQLAS